MTSVLSFSARLTRPDFALGAAFEAGPGVTALVGPSGCGKSTVLRLLAGLERAESGQARLGETTLFDVERRVFAPPWRRRVGMVFQDALLFPHLSVAANLRYGGWFAPRAAAAPAFDAVVETLGIGRLLARRPATLSGGERQRVAIGRALLAAPRLLLMDEPLAALDAARKAEILPFIERLRDEFAVPIVYVTHAPAEAARLAARVVRMQSGRVVAVGAPADVPLADGDAPGTIVSTLVARRAAWRPEYGVSILTHPAGEIVVLGRAPDGESRLTLAARDVALARNRPEGVSLRTALAGRLLRIDRRGPHALATLELDGGERLVALATCLAVDALGLREGDPCWALARAVALDAADLGRPPAWRSAGSVP